MATRDRALAPTPDRGERGAPIRVGVLAIQGDFAAHAAMLDGLGADAVEVRSAGQLDGLDGLVIPGGESTTIAKGVADYGLEQPLRKFVSSGVPTFGTCAGLILLDRVHLGLIDIEARRNAYGHQVHSFEAPVRVRGLGDEAVDAVFIRAPRVEHWGSQVEVLAELDGHPVVAREGNVIVASFHPELTDDARLHALFCGSVDTHAARHRRTETEEPAR